MGRRLLLGVLLVVIVAAGWAVRSGSGTPFSTLPAPTAQLCVNGAVPTECIFGLSGVRYVVESQYAYEASLLDYSPPVGDYDYILPPGVQEYVTLPGHLWDRYHQLAPQYVDGSGWVMKTVTPNGGRLDYLHLQVVYTATSAPTLVALPPAPITETLPPVFDRAARTEPDGDAATAIAAAQLQPAPGAAPRVVGGGARIGLSRWPDWAVYGNGLAGPSNAHLCVLMDARALQWLWTVATHRDAFPRARWGPKPYKDRHQRLRWQAVVWSSHQWLGRYERQHFHRATKTMVYAYRHGHATCGLTRHRCTVKHS